MIARCGNCHCTIEFDKLLEYIEDELEDYKE